MTDRGRAAIDWLTENGSELDLGVARVEVAVDRIDSNLWGMMQLNERRITLCPELKGENLTVTLWHEVWHVLDRLALKGAIEAMGKDEDHHSLDVLAVLVDQTLRRNWPFWQRVYGATGGGGGAASAFQSGRRRQRRRQPRRR